MKNLGILLALVFSVSAHAQSVTKSASTKLPKSYFVGEYSLDTKIKSFDYDNKKECEEEGAGTFANGFCWVSSSNTVTIERDRSDLLVNVDVVFGAANMRDFSGMVTAIQGNVLTVVEGLVETRSPIHITKDTCVMKIKVQGKTATLKLGSGCDADLSRASGATKN